jgi:hypothetical protein
MLSCTTAVPLLSDTTAAPLYYPAQQLCLFDLIHQLRLYVILHNSCASFIWYISCASMLSCATVVPLLYDTTAVPRLSYTTAALLCCPAQQLCLCFVILRNCYTSKFSAKVLRFYRTLLSCTTAVLCYTVTFLRYSFHTQLLYFYVFRTTAVLLVLYPLQQLCSYVIIDNSCAWMLSSGTSMLFKCPRQHPFFYINLL